MGKRSAVPNKVDGAARRSRRRGSGGVFAVRDGVWRVDVEITRDPVTGRRRRVSRTIHGTREDAEVALARLRVADHEKRLPTGGTNARSVGAAFQLYQQAVDAGLIELAPSTVATVRSASKIMGGTELADGRQFGTIRLSRLTWQDIEYLYAAMRASGKSPAYVRRCATVLARALDLARKRGLIDSNPVKDATSPRTTRSKPFAPTGDEVRALVAVVQRRDPEIGDAGLVLASTGMRRGEFLAIRWCDLKLDQAELHVAAAITDGGPGVGVVRKSTKRSDWRDIPLTAAACQAFKRQAERRTELIGSPPEPEEYAFPKGPDGRQPMRPDEITNRWAGARGSSRITLLHLRHYTATAMLDAGESYRTVADILGNSEATLRLHYDGRTDVGKRKAITALEL
ncbi:MAG: tyrosine-type recombinase/integrase [Actinomycetota bacterium]|nr:tyrosine-type recombinase/integrase [Actinomycetota bacterium]